MWSILDQNEVLNNVNYPMLSEFLTAFKIPDNNILESSEKLVKIKQKILDIITDEKEECANYLTLPKFKNMSDQSKSTLKNVMTEVWNTFLSKSSEEEKSKKYSRFFLQSEDPKQIE